MIHTASNVRIVLVKLENKFVRIQAIGPTTEAGGLRAAGTGLAMAMLLPLHQRHATIEPIHGERGGKADREEYGHSDQDHLDRLPRLVEHRAGEDADEIGIADGHR